MIVERNPTKISDRGCIPLLIKEGLEIVNYGAK
jgi:hypothetical protein